MPRKRPLRSLSPWILVLAGVFAGCQGDSTGPSVQYIPTGDWMYQIVDSARGFRNSGVIELVSQSAGTIFDTVFTRTGNLWNLTSTTLTRLRFHIVGDGYQRCIATTTTSGSAGTDTSLSYRYFFLRGDTLCEYNGFRFLGANAGLTGKWSTPPEDAAILPKSASLEFTSDSLFFDDGWSAVRYGYKTLRDTVSFTPSDPFPGRDRYEVVPGWALYITSHARLYARVK